MNFGSNIKTMLKEAELYRSQGLLNEALQQYKAVEAMIRKNENVKNSDAFLARISTKIDLINKEIDKLNKPAASRKVSDKAQNLMREMFTFDDPNIKGSAALGGAISLAEFGQHEKAIEEFLALLDYDNLRLDAAKNTIKYEFKYQGADSTVTRFEGFVKDARFLREEIAILQQYLQDLLKQAGIEKNLEQIVAAKPVVPEYEVDDDDILDISAIRLKLTKGPQKGEKIELDVNFQHGSQINLIISQKEKGIIESMDGGDLINGVIFYSPVAIFSGTVHVLSKKPIGAGPKRGDFSINLKIVRIEAG